MSFFSDVGSYLKPDRVLSNASTARGATASALAQPGHMKAEPARSPEAQALFDVKKNILAQVRANAPDGERPTLEQYRLACEAHAQTDQGKAMAERGEWNSKVHADLSGQDLSGFTITEPKKLLVERHYLDAQEPAPAEETHGHYQIQSDYDSHDRDGDGQINAAAQSPFYDNVRFDGADLHGSFVEPATSFNEEIAKAGNLEGLTFNGMREGDTFTFGSGVYKNACMTNINDGQVLFAENCQVQGINIEGTAAKITIGAHASVDHIAVNDAFRIISLDMGKGSVLSNSDLGQSTVSMTSQFEPGATFKNVQLSGNLEGLDFSGLKLNNVSIDGKPISHASQLGQYGITTDHATVASASPDLVRNYELNQIRNTMQNALQSVGNPLTNEELAAVSVTQQMREARQQHETYSMAPPLGRKA